MNRRQRQMCIRDSEMCDEMSLIGNPNESIRRRIIFMGPTGQPFTQEKACELASYDQVVLICGHYEGVDYRVEKHLVDETISIGDYVLTGGELPAMVVTDAVARMIPGVLGAASGAQEHSFYESLLECQQYTSLQNLEGGLFQMYCAVVIIKILPHGVKRKH